MDNEKIYELEKRITELESLHSNADARKLWEEVRNERDFNKILEKFKKSNTIRKPTNRAQVHGAVDNILSNGDDGVAITWTIVVTSSEPCVIIVATAITVTVCD